MAEEWLIKLLRREFGMNAEGENRLDGVISFIRTLEEKKWFASIVIAMLLKWTKEEDEDNR